MSEETKYNCVFKPDEECPVRTEYKLKPENLLGYCKICHMNPKTTLKTNELVNYLKLMDSQFAKGLELMMKINSLNIQEPRTEIAKTDPMMIVLQNLPKLLEMYSRLKKEEKEQLVDVIKLLRDIQ